MKIFLKESQGYSVPEYEVVGESTLAISTGNPNYKFYEITGMKEVKADVKIVDA